MRNTFSEVLKMLRSIGSRIALIHVCYFVLLSAVVLSTVLLLERQKDDGLVVNLSGRQRMLTQRMTHQLLTFASHVDSGRDTQAQRSLVHGSMQVFETTLLALKDGGPAPLDLQMVNVRVTPQASPAVAQQLGRVLDLYTAYGEKAHAILDGDEPARSEGVTYVTEHNTQLLSEMNAAVNLMQAEAERRVLLLYIVQAGALGIGLLLIWILSGITRRTVVEPLRELNQASDAMSRGDVYRPIRTQGPIEIHELSSSFERLRVAMKNLLGHESRSPGGL
jgi:methyl-accepting chemotaxis protein